MRMHACARARVYNIYNTYTYFYNDDDEIMKFIKVRFQLKHAQLTKFGNKSMYIYMYMQVFERLSKHE